MDLPAQVRFGGTGRGGADAERADERGVGERVVFELEAGRAVGVDEGESEGGFVEAEVLVAEDEREVVRVFIERERGERSVERDEKVGGVGEFGGVGAG